LTIGKNDVFHGANGEGGNSDNGTVFQFQP